MFSAEIITGMVGGNYYRCFRRKLLLVFAGGDTIASFSIRRMGIIYIYIMCIYIYITNIVWMKLIDVYKKMRTG